VTSVLLTETVSYVVLARKYRPLVFDDMVGQEHVGRTLGNAIRQDRVHHAYLFAGARGLGKTTTARIFAKGLVCEQGPTANPCNTCEQCVAVTEGRSVDVVEIDGASNNSVDNIRNLREQVHYLPQTARRKVYIIDEVHMLTTSAFNALLKTLEEPPEHVNFIFATTEPQKVIPTILSRVSRLDFRRVSPEEAVAHLQNILQKEERSVDAGGLRLIARAAGGSVRDTLTLLDQVIAFADDPSNITEEETRRVLGQADRARIADLVGAILSHDPDAVMAQFDELVTAGHDLTVLSIQLLEHMRDLTLAAVCKSPAVFKGATESEVKLLREHASKADPVTLSQMFDRFSRVVDRLPTSRVQRMLLEMGLLDLAHDEPLMPLEDIVAKLESMGGGGPGGGGGGGGFAPPQGRGNPGQGRGTPPGRRADAPASPPISAAPAPVPTSGFAPPADVKPTPEPAITLPTPKPGDFVPPAGFVPSPGPEAATPEPEPEPAAAPEPAPTPVAPTPRTPGPGDFVPPPGFGVAPEPEPEPEAAQPEPAAPAPMQAKAPGPGDFVPPPGFGIVPKPEPESEPESAAPQAEAPAPQAEAAPVQPKAPGPGDFVPPPGFGVAPQREPEPEPEPVASEPEPCAAPAEPVAPPKPPGAGDSELMKGLWDLAKHAVRNDAPQRPPHEPPRDAAASEAPPRPAAQQGAAEATRCGPCSEPPPNPNAIDLELTPAFEAWEELVSRVREREEFVSAVLSQVGLVSFDGGRLEVCAKKGSFPHIELTSSANIRSTLEQAARDHLGKPFTLELVDDEPSLEGYPSIVLVNAYRKEQRQREVEAEALDHTAIQNVLHTFNATLMATKPLE